jgi:adenylate cyclase
MPTSTQTFLFADLVGFTALAETDGDERALQAVLQLQRLARGLFAHYRPEQVKAIGDGLMLRSATPGDAIRFGIRLLAALGDRPDSLPLRIGIHTGPALSSDGDWYGKTVNVAARLCSVAPPGEVIVSAAARSPQVYTSLRHRRRARYLPGLQPT